MLLLGTKKLLQRLKAAPIEKDLNAFVSIPAMYRWHADVVTVGRRKAVVLVNDETFFTLVFYGLEDSDFARFEEIVSEGIRIALSDHCINDAVIDMYLSKYSSMTYSKTMSKAHIAHLSVILDDVQNNFHDYQADSLVQSLWSRRLNKFPIQTDQGLIVPKVAMVQALARESDVSIFKTKAVELHVEVTCDKRVLSRTLMVPYCYSFRDLHKILHIAFNWPNHQPHVFDVKDERGLSLKMIGLVEDQREEKEEEKKMYPEGMMYLASVFNEHSVIYYTYGRNKKFIHRIKRIQIISNYERNTPLCLEGTGTLRFPIVEEADGKQCFGLIYEETFTPDDVNARLTQYFGA